MENKPKIKYLKPTHAAEVKACKTVNLKKDTNAAANLNIVYQQLVKTT